MPKVIELITDRERDNLAKLRVRLANVELRARLAEAAREREARRAEAA